jgi:formylglycine-generating enzyme required for sulfatase activity
MLEELEFCLVPAGPFVMGNLGDTSGTTSRDESPEHTCELAWPFWVGRHPITTAQFLRFVEATAAHPGTGRLWPTQPSNYPITNISWYEAWAFCEWLADQWRPQLPAGWTVRLPSEAEWEKAARGGLLIPQTPQIRAAKSGFTEPLVGLKSNPQPRRRYPWGNEASPKMANYADSGHGSVMQVGSFPAGASPYGVEDLSGNISEWTRSVWGPGWDEPDYWYPYEAKDGREDLGASPRMQRVTRGGALYVTAMNLRCTARYHCFPLDGDRHVGFRVVVAPSG